MVTNMQNGQNGWYENKYGYLSHYVNDKLHNEKGPAVIWKDGTKFWRQNWIYYHRLDGPAVELNNGYKEWHYQGKKIQCSSQREFERYLKLKPLW